MRRNGNTGIASKICEDSEVEMDFLYNFLTVYDPTVMRA